MALIAGSFACSRSYRHGGYLLGRQKISVSESIKSCWGEHGTHMFLMTRSLKVTGERTSVIGCKKNQDLTVLKMRIKGSHTIMALLLIESPIIFLRKHRQI